VTLEHGAHVVQLLPDLFGRPCDQGAECCGGVGLDVLLEAHAPVTEAGAKPPALHVLSCLVALIGRCREMQ